MDPTNTELLSQKQKLLQASIKDTETRLESLKQADKKAKSQLESGDLGQDKYDALQREIVDTEQKLKSLNDQLKKTDASGFSAKLGDVSSKAKSAGDAIQPLSTAAAGLGAAMLATIPATEELRSDLSKLDNNARGAGVGIDETRAAFEAFNVVSDETDSSVEATSNLLQAGFTESNLQKAVEGLSGAYLRFPDTLKIESLADSLQETLATGQATGQFGELLDRLGIGADNFSSSLEKCTSDAEKQNLALKTLADAGLMDTYNGWIENNSALAESKQANMEFQESISELATTLQPIITDVTEFATKIVDAFNSLSPAAQKVVLAIIGIVAAAGPLLSIIGSVGMAIAGLGTAIMPVIGIISGVVVAIIIAISIVQNWGNIVEWFQGVWNTVWTNVQNLWNTVWNAVANNPIVQSIVTTVKNLFNGLASSLSAIWNTIKSVASNAWELIKNVTLAPVLLLIDLITGDFDALKSDLKNILNNIKSAASNIWNAIKSSVSNIVSNIKTFAINAFRSMVSGIGSALSGLGGIIQSGFQSAINFITSLPGKAIAWGRDFIDGLKDGILSGISGIVDAVRGIGDKIRSFLHFSRPDEGPLRDYETWMPDMMKGLAQGIYDNLPVLDKAVSAAAKSINYEIMKDAPAQSIDYARMYNAVKAGASDSSTIMYIGDREFKRTLRGMGVVFEG